MYGDAFCGAGRIARASQGKTAPDTSTGANNSSFTGTILSGTIRIVRRTIVSEAAGLRLYYDGFVH
jgi:hypothetical protein